MKIVKAGKGYSSEVRPQLQIKNLYEEEVETVKNDGYRDDLVGEFQDILKDLPEGGLSASPQDLQAIEDSYEQVPKERKNAQNALRAEKLAGMRPACFPWLARYSNR